jgi:hypothetical protein
MAERDDARRTLDAVRTKLDEIASRRSGPSVVILEEGLRVDLGRGWSSPDGNVTFGFWKWCNDFTPRIASNASSTSTCMAVGEQMRKQVGDFLYKVTVTEANFAEDYIRIHATKKILPRKSSK